MASSIVCPVTNWLPNMRIARSTPLRINGSPPFAIRRVNAAPRPVSLLVLTNLPVTNKPQVAALTNKDGDSPKCLAQSPLLILSAIKRSAVWWSGIRSNASAKHIKATPSSEDNENSCISASTPDARVRCSRTAVTSLCASCATSFCKLSWGLTCESNHCTASTSFRR